MRSVALVQRILRCACIWSVRSRRAAAGDVPIGSFPDARPLGNFSIKLYDILASHTCAAHTHTHTHTHVAVGTLLFKHFPLPAVRFPLDGPQSS